MTKTFDHQNVISLSPTSISLKSFLTKLRKSHVVFKFAVGFTLRNCGKSKDAQMRWKSSSKDVPPSYFRRYNRITNLHTLRACGVVQGLPSLQTIKKQTQRYLEKMLHLCMSKTSPSHGSYTVPHQVTLTFCLNAVHVFVSQNISEQSDSETNSYLLCNCNGSA